jgi:hypothetical protein
VCNSIYRRGNKKKKITNMVPKNTMGRVHQSKQTIKGFNTKIHCPYEPNNWQWHIINEKGSYPSIWKKLILNITGFLSLIDKYEMQKGWEG